MSHQNVVSYDQVTTGRVIVTTTRVVSYCQVTTTRVVSYDHVTSTRVISYALVTTLQDRQTAKKIGHFGNKILAK